MNVGRGGHLIEEDLIAALDSGHLAGAVLDVFQTEPLPETSPDLEHPKIIVTPHIAGITDRPRSPRNMSIDGIASDRTRREHPKTSWIQSENIDLGAVRSEDVHWRRGTCLSVRSAFTAAVGIHHLTSVIAASDLKLPVMIISYSHNFVFIKTRKTAGSSLETVLAGYAGPEDIVTPLGFSEEIERFQTHPDAFPRNFAGDRNLEEKFRSAVRAENKREMKAVLQQVKGDSSPVANLRRHGGALQAKNFLGKEHGTPHTNFDRTASI